MAKKTDLTITSLNSTDNKKVTNKISYVNPNITNNQAILLAQSIASLTTDSYQSTTRTDTTECDVTINRPVTVKYAHTSGQGSTSTIYDDVPQDGVINLTTEQIFNKQLILILTTTTRDGCAPIIDIISDTDTVKPLLFTEGKFYYDASYSAVYYNSWLIYFATNASSSASGRDDITARTFVARITFNASSTVDAWSKEFTFVITDPTP